ncbi:AraC family transcriptional regulator [Aureimonas glaciei]|uniref:AraC family transcriptional regulator n=1 Tax=Aureimonas glaciei TaxID=1776957 RepID=A0A916YD96_9HYPH|nr:AraC family transcriptional regulator [Aureimonas glaciei]GGD40902.1 AraC family transcriptional regulator [Aureimonas glaciei]
MIPSKTSNSQVDPLSEVLSVLGARGIRLTRLEASGDWALAFSARQRLKFVAMLRGECWIVPQDRRRERLTQGDVFLIGDTSYAVTSDPAPAPIDGDALYAEADRVRLGGMDCVMVGGGIDFASADARFVLDALPPFLRVDPASASAIAGLLDLLDREVGDDRPGSALVAARLAEILLVEAIRAYVAVRREEEAGWIGALGDPRIGASLRLIHGDVAHPWTVGELAARVGMSRSGFARRFAERVGRPPLGYLTHWRMILARRMLRGDAATVARVATGIGYASESAFAHAFRRTFGHAPRQAAPAMATAALPVEAAAAPAGTNDDGAGKALPDRGSAIHTHGADAPTMP